MENKSSNGWKFFALLFGALLAGVVGLYIYKQQNPDYDPWEEPWENSSSPVDLGIAKDADKDNDSDEDTDAEAESDNDASADETAAEENTQAEDADESAK